MSIALEAHAGCAPTPGKYRELQYGDARFAIEETCRQTFTQNEQFFLAGAARQLQSACKLPRSSEGRALVERFVSAAQLSLDLQSRYNSGSASRSARASAFAAGMAMVEDIECSGPEAALLSRGIGVYLKRTSGSSRFVEGCTAAYGPRYGSKECRCIADALRTIVPDVDDHFFDREVIKDSIHRSPRVALTLMLSCRVSEY